MKKLFQSLDDGKTTIADVAPPLAQPGTVVVRSICSLVSAGTERMLVDFGKAGPIGKARQQPERVGMVLDKVRTDGLLTTYEAVRNKLDKPVELGYSNVGVVVSVGPGVTRLVPGDRIISNGSHAEIVRVPENLCAKVPESVESSHAAFTVVGSIGLQGIRLANPTLGESVAVIGTGLIGLLTIQMLRAHGCRVLAVDIEPQRLALAKQFGAQVCNSAEADPVEQGMTFSNAYGLDAVIITAATDSDELVSQAARMSRKRGRIVLVGVAGLQLNRAEFYEKELTFQVSCSYGPGRYDSAYEEKGQDYPIGFVRWTEQRNFEAVLELLATSRLDVKPLITASYPFERAADAYAQLTSDKQCLGLLLEYSDSPDKSTTVALHDEPEPVVAGGAVVVGLAGLGNYAASVLVPALTAAGAQLHTLVSTGAGNSRVKGNRFRFHSNDFDAMLQNAAISLVVVSTRHNSHARLVLDALQAGKHVFVEKPLCLTLEELDAIEAVNAESDTLLMVGFNRRFAPLVVKMKKLLQSVSSPLSCVMTINAGEIPADHWTQDLQQGGGRIIGEACHFIDLARFLVDAPITDHSITYMDSRSNDTAVISLKFEDGSVAVINYLANGHRSIPKERIEVFSGGRVLQLDNYRQLTGKGWPRFRKQSLFRLDKGNNACVKALLDVVRKGGVSPISAAELFEVSRVAIELGNSSRQADA